MATVTIITGTLEFYDSFGVLKKALARNPLIKYNIDGIQFKKRRFDRIIIAENGDIIKLPPILAFDRMGNKFGITQTMGSAKTVILMQKLAKAHKNGRDVACNVSIEFMPHNLDKPKEEWTPNLRKMDDLIKANNCVMGIDDYKKIVKKWQSDEAEFISALVNASRKDNVDIIFTVQRVINFIAPDIREVASNYEIPYVTIRDMRKPSPDGMGVPIEIEIFNVSANFVFLGFGLWNGWFPDGKIIQPSMKMLNAYSTLEKVSNMKDEEVESVNIHANRELYSGYNNELKVVNELKSCAGITRHIAFEHPHEHEADIVYTEGDRTYLIDNVGTNMSNGSRNLNTTRKNFRSFDLSDKKKIRLLSYEFKGVIYYIDYKHLVNYTGTIRISKELRSKSLMAKELFKLI